MGGYEAWERMQEVILKERDHRSIAQDRILFLAATGSTCKQGKPNGNKKREVTTLTLGRRRSKKRRLTQLKAIGSEGCLPYS
ncbi:hypothetical protein Lal_00001618 [Lupinus albus]|nr:hypothetical protein Lal_00001618 [Lupinus albus]